MTALFRRVSLFLLLFNTFQDFGHLIYSLITDDSHYLALCSFFFLSQINYASQFPERALLLQATVSLSEPSPHTVDEPLLVNNPRNSCQDANICEESSNLC